MVRFERSNDRKKKKYSKGSYQKKPDKSRRHFEDNSKSRHSIGEPNRNNGDRSEFTTVTCSSCNSECKVPFRPTQGKPVYCRDCFSKNNKVSIEKFSERDIDIINQKLNKIMKALDIK
ncbi:MAG: CxxC-x17-CxxC domain-containing protein [Nanoarchaeota archaeon]